MNNRQLFLNHVAQVSNSPLGIEIERADSVYLFDNTGKQYIDFISGISVSNVGHCHPEVVNAITKQIQQYMHVMVFGELIQGSQVQLAKALTDILPKNLNSVYFTNSGAEATEGSLKLAKRVTGRSEIICFTNAYHGSTHGALSVMGNEDFKQAFRPLLPDIKIIEYNNATAIKSAITSTTAAVILEPIQSETGYIESTIKFLQIIKDKCLETGALLIFDEIQSGFGRSGSMFAFEQSNIVPDILLLAKGMGGGLPIGCFISDVRLMNALTHNPALGHITTFGGNAVCCAASLACLQVILNNNLHKEVNKKSVLIKSLLTHSAIKSIKGKGFMLSIEFETEDLNMKIINQCIKNGLFVDWFLFNTKALRITPPLIISDNQIKQSINILNKSINEVLKEA